jgi:hypothetical protein
MNIFLVVYGNGEFTVDIVSAHRMRENADRAAFQVTAQVDSRRSSLGMPRLNWKRADDVPHRVRWEEIGGLWVEVRARRVEP